NVDDVLLLDLLIVASDGEVAARTCWRGEDFLGYGIRESDEDRLDDSLARLGRTTGNRTGVFCIQESTFWIVYVDRFEDSRVKRQVWENVLHSDMNCRSRSGDNAVHRTETRRTGFGQVDVHLGPLNSYSHRNPQGFIDDAVRVQKGLTLIDTVRNLL